MGLSVITAPTTKPVSVDELKNHLRIFDDFENTLLELYRDAAVLNIEHWMKRQFITAEYELTLDWFPAGDIVLPVPPLIIVNSITYIDVAGDSQTWAAANYSVDTTSIKGRIRPIPTATYPTTQADRFNAVTVNFDAGYGAATAVPIDVKLAITALAGHWFEQREPIAPGAVVAEVPFFLKHLVDGEGLKEVF